MPPILTSHLWQHMLNTATHCKIKIKAKQYQAYLSKLKLIQIHIYQKTQYSFFFNFTVSLACEVHASREI